MIEKLIDVKAMLQVVGYCGSLVGMWFGLQGSVSLIDQRLKQVENRDVPAIQRVETRIGEIEKKIDVLVYRLDAGQ